MEPLKEREGQILSYMKNVIKKKGYPLQSVKFVQP